MMHAPRALAVIAMAIFSMCLMAPTATAQSTGTSQKWTSTGWKAAVAGDEHSCTSVESSVVGNTEYWLLKTNGSKVFRVATDDGSLSDGETQLLADAEDEGDGVMVTIGPGPTVEGVEPN